MKTRHITITAVLMFTLFLNHVDADRNVLKLKNTSGNLVAYSGTISVSGEFRWQFDDESLRFNGNSICFYVDHATSTLIPRAGNDKRSAWFCFSNRDEAKKFLAIPKEFPSDHCGFTGTATIVITDYVVNRAQHAVHDYARLVKTISIGTPKPFICKECMCRPNWPDS